MEPSDQNVPEGASPLTARFDVGILTIIPPELQAVQDVLAVKPRNRKHIQGTIYWEGTKYSELLDCDLGFVLSCAGTPTQASAALAATNMIQNYAPSVVILLGIAAGKRGKLKIGDVIVPRDVADFSVKVIEDGEEKQRPRIIPLNYAVLQMLQAFRFDRTRFLKTFQRQFGLPIQPKAGQEAEFAAGVTFEPTIHDNALASMDALLRDKAKWEDLCKTHQGIRASEMESGGFIRACEGRHPSTPWLVIRGISDFGDAFKNDDFHRLASCAAAAYLDLFLTDGLDLETIGIPREQYSKRQSLAAVSTQPIALAAEQSQDDGDSYLSPLAANLINEQLDKLSHSLTDATLQKVDEVRELWHSGRGAEAFQRLKEIKKSPGWSILQKEAKFRALRLEASFALNLENSTDRAKALIQEAAKEGPREKLQGLEALLAFKEGFAADALKMLEEPRNVESWNVRLALFLETGKWAEAIKAFETPPKSITPDAESKRLYSLCLLQAGKVEVAIQQIRDALDLHPTWFSMRMTSAQIAYFSSLSPALLSSTAKHWPAPCDPALVKRDWDTLERLRNAEANLTSLMNTTTLDPDLRIELEGWKLACLANDAERQNEAQNYCAELLEQNPGHPIAVHWALARDYVSDLNNSVEALLAAVEQQS